MDSEGVIQNLNQIQSSSQEPNILESQSTTITTSTISSSSNNSTTNVPTSHLIVNEKELDEFEDDVDDLEKWVRRSDRNPQLAMLEKTDVRIMFDKIKRNHTDTIVFKLKDHVHADINTVVFEEMIKCFKKNNVCQALYLQNLSHAVADKQLKMLLDLLVSKKNIWCLNFGENYNISKSGWNQFCDMLPKTSVTHLYVSEHVITPEMKNKMRDIIRANRKKHDLHCSFNNIHVIKRCTNMWWNPINAIRHQIENAYQASLQRKGKRKLSEDELTPAHREYWVENGKSGLSSWKFNCACGEVCSSYENPLYHPTGRMFECTHCSVWSHTECIYGNISEADMQELSEVLCKKCKSNLRRDRLRMLKEYGITWESILKDSEDSTDSPHTTNSTNSGTINSTMTTEENPGNFNLDNATEGEGKDNDNLQVNSKDGTKETVSLSTEVVENKPVDDKGDNISSENDVTKTTKKRKTRNKKSS